jgi:hypothetical protein
MVSIYSTLVWLACIVSTLLLPAQLCLDLDRPLPTQALTEPLVVVCVPAAGSTFPRSYSGQLSVPGV